MKGKKRRMYIIKLVIMFTADDTLVCENESGVGLPHVDVFGIQPYHFCISKISIRLIADLPPIDALVFCVGSIVGTLELIANAYLS